MPIDDLMNLPDDVHFAADVCLVGSGPAAWTLSKELSDSGIRVLVLESGASRLADDTTALNDTEDVGMPLFNGRYRVFGGTTEAPGWRNRCTPFDAIDYARRPWVPRSGWPFGADEVAPYLSRAAQYLGTENIFSPSFAPPAYTGVVPARIDEALLSHVYWGFGSDRNGRATRFSNAFRLHGSPLVRVVQHATVTQLNVDPSSGRIASVEIADRAGRRRTIAARLVVLCAGGIENPRLLLNSNRQAAAGLGNRHDLVGRYLMDHPRDLNMAITFDPSEARRMRRILGPFNVRSDAGSHLYVGGYALSPQVQRDEGLLNCVAWAAEEDSADDPVAAALRLVFRYSTQRSADLRRVRARPADVVRALHARLVSDQPMASLAGKLGFVIASEQVPDPDSRVSLSERCDRFGMRLACTDWRVGRQERASQGRLARIIAAECRRLGLPQARLAPWIEDEAYGDTTPLQDGCHPTGTTRLAAEPTAGVVDPNCEVFGVGGLFVAGSSVFPTAGHANPTLMIVAMACRLARYLGAQVEARDRPHEPAAEAVEVDSVPQTDALPAERPSLAPGTRVAVTGANGFIGGRLVETLTAQGAVVTCLNRGSSSGRLRQTGAAARRLDLADPEAAKAALEGVQVVFHCAYDWNDEPWNLRALRSLVAAATENRCERFVHVSSFVVYEGPAAGELTETTEETTADSGYARIKRDMELELFKAHREHGFPCTILQPTIVYGPHSSPWTVQPAERLKFGTVILPEPGDGICTAVHVDDVVDAMLLSATHPGAVGERFLVSGPDRVTWAQFYELLAEALRVPGPHYATLDRIKAESRKLRHLRRHLTSLEQLVRRGAQVGPVRRTLKKVMPALPPGLRDGLEDRLYGPDTRRRGHVHWPDFGNAQWLTWKAAIGSQKARQRLDYRPRVGLAAGMASLEPYLRALFPR